MPCAEAGRVRSPPWRCQFVWIRFSRIAKQSRSQGRARALCACARWPSRWPRTARRRDGSSGNKIVHPPAIDIGFAVEAEDGVLVPVLRDADKKPLKDLVAAITNWSNWRANASCPTDATGGSIATVTNFGTFGLDLGHADSACRNKRSCSAWAPDAKCPSWDEAKEQFVPVMEANLTLSFDHRVLDGGAAGRLLGRIATLLQHPDLL